jgi:hypothetical protein
MHITFSNYLQNFSNILLSRLTPYAEEIIGENQCGFRRNRSNSDNLFCICQTLEKKREYYEAVRQLFAFNILIESGIHIKLIRLIKMCLNETYSRDRVDKHLSDLFPIMNGLKQGHDLSPLLFNFILECVIRRVQVNHDCLKLNGTHHILVYADDVNILGGSMYTIRKAQKLC